MTKTEFMLIGSRQKLNIITDSPVVSINGTPVNHVLTSKALGVLIDGNLTWGSHIEKMAKIIASGIAAIKRVGQFVLPSSNIASYLQSLDSATFRLLNVVWGNCGVKLADKLQKLQNCEASSNFLKLRRRCIAAVPNFQLEKILVLSVISNKRSEFESDQD